MDITSFPVIEENPQRYEGCIFNVPGWFFCMCHTLMSDSFVSDQVLRPPSPRESQETAHKGSRERTKSRYLDKIQSREITTRDLKHRKSECRTRMLSTEKPAIPHSMTLNKIWYLSYREVIRCDCLTGSKESVDWIMDPEANGLTDIISCLLCNFLPHQSLQQ